MEISVSITLTTQFLAQEINTDSTVQTQENFGYPHTLTATKKNHRKLYRYHSWLRIKCPQSIMEQLPIKQSVYSNIYMMNVILYRVVHVCSGEILELATAYNYIMSKMSKRHFFI